MSSSKEKRKIERLNKLAKECILAYRKNPDLWIETATQSFSGYYAKTISYVIFDYPDYGGLSKRISNRLSSDCVDVIQMFFYNVANGCKKATIPSLRKTFKEYLEYGYDM